MAFLTLIISVCRGTILPLGGADAGREVRAERDYFTRRYRPWLSCACAIKISELNGTANLRPARYFILLNERSVMFHY